MRMAICHIQKWSEKVSNILLRNISPENNLALKEYAKSKDISISKAADIILKKVFIDGETLEREQELIDVINRNTNAFNEMIDVYRHNTKQLELIMKYLNFNMGE